MKPTRRVAVRGIIFKNGKIFAVKQKDAEGNINSFWSTPGSGLDDGESITDGLQRELIEEIGITPTIGRLLLIQQFFVNGKEHMEFFFHIENTDDYKEIDLKKTSHGDLEIAEYGFIDPIGELILLEILQSYDLAKHLTDNKPPVVMYCKR